MGLQNLFKTQEEMKQLFKDFKYRTTKEIESKSDLNNRIRQITYAQHLFLKLQKIKILMNIYELVWKV